MQTGEAMIMIENLSHCFGALQVLRAVDLTLADGEILAVLGPSGCGKSTLLNIVAGLEIPVAGSVQLGRGASIATVFQDPTLLPWCSVAGNVGLVLAHKGLKAADLKRRVSAALAKVGLSDFADHFPKTLSGGMRQRVNLARALVVAPEILLMDEPLSGLDEVTRDDLLDTLIQLWRDSQFTCIYVTHSLTEAVRLGHRVVVLSERPARIQGIVPIDLPHNMRQDSHPAIRAARGRILSLVRQTVPETEISDARAD